MKTPAARGLTSLCALLLTVCAVSFLPAACRDKTSLQTQVQSPQAIIDLLTQTESLCDRGSLDSAGTILQKALSALDGCSTLTVTDSATVNCLLCSHYYSQSQDEDARRHCILAFETMLRSPVIADSLRGRILEARAFYFSEEKLFDTAAILAEQALNISLAQEPPNYPAIAGNLTTLASIEYDRRNFDAAIKLWKQILGLVRLIPLQDEGFISGALMSTASFYTSRGEWAAAESTLVQTRTAFEQAHGPNHALSAIALAQISFALIYSGRQYEGIGTAKRAIEIFESLPDSLRSELPYTYHYLAGAYSSFGLYSQAENFFYKEAALDSSMYGPQTVQLCYPLMGLADLRRIQCQYDEAETLYMQALARARAGWGQDTEQAGEAYRSLGTLYLAARRPPEAAEMFQMAGDVWNRHGTMTHQRSISVHIGLGLAAALQKRYPEALARIRLAREELQEQTAPAYSSVRSYLKNGAEIFCAAHQYDSALQLYGQLIANERSMLERSFPYLTESQRLQWLNTVPLVHSGLISLALQVNQPRYLDAALEMTINAKARAIDAGLAERHIALCSSAQEARPILDEYLSVSGQLANLTYMQMTQSQPSLATDKLSALAARRDSLELSLSRVCFESEGPLNQPTVSNSTVFAQLAPGAVLWDVVRYCPSDTSSPIQYGNCPCDENYAVFVCDATGVRALQDMGPVEEIDSLVVALRKAVSAEVECVYSPLAPLHEERIRRIAEQITHKLPPLPARDSASPGTLYISPDGLLGLLPFELLALDSNRSFIDGYRIVYLASSRDLAADVASTLTTRRAVIFAAPAFDASGSFENPVANESSLIKTRAAISEELSGCFGNGFVPLPQTDREANSVATLLESINVPTTVRIGQEATESSVRLLANGPSIIHFATHGFFCDQAETAALPSLSSPLLRSGLALAGANLTLRGAARSTQDDGILTAYEISAMNLSATELVVLSACETGAGDVSRSEGVLGLTRAFRQAGARSVIMNLWNAPDEVAGETMTEFYRLWTGGATKADALRGALLLAKKHAQQRYGHTHPYLWCGFVLVGDPQ